IAAALDVSPTALVLTLFTEALARVDGRESFSLALTANDRAFLPRDADGVVGPFTSTIVFVAGNPLAEPLPDAIRETHRMLWRDLGHAAVSGVSALRELRARDRTAGPSSLPVVFTSLLDTGPADRGERYVPPVSYAVSQTSGVALDHQMWEHDGELRIRWDVTGHAFAPGVVEATFAAFVNSLHTLAADPPGAPAVVRSMNELQKAYYVARATAGPRPHDGCQVHHSFHVPDLDVARLSRAWLRMVAGYEVLRTEVSFDGRLRVRPAAPANWHVPVVDVDGDAGPVLSGAAHEMAGRSYPLGRCPRWELRVTRPATGDATVHVGIDLLVADGRSIHFLFRELFRLYADPSARPRPAAPFEEHARWRAELAAGSGQAAAAEHWRTRFADLPPGPPLDLDGEPVRRVRFSGTLAGWPAVAARAREHGLTPDDLLLAALTETLAIRFTDPFAVSVVRWTSGTERFRPGEFTALSWVRRSGPRRDPLARAAEYRRALAEDAAAEAVDGLAELRKVTMRERRRRSFAFPVVYTGILELSDLGLPPGVRPGPWLTYTPDVGLDCIAIAEGDELRYYWDTAPTALPDGAFAELFAGYEQALRRLAAADTWPGATPASPPPADRDTILYAWNDTGRVFPDTAPVHALFERCAQRRPDAVALRFPGGTMTYGEVNRRANRIARRLRAHGVGAETVVGISLRRGPDMVAAVFGVLKAGGAYLPLEPSLPGDRARTMMSDAGCTVLVTASGTAGWRPAGDVRLVEVDRDPQPAGGEADLDPVTTPANTAYIIFTSGSTGRPKGVAVAHRAVLNLLNWCYRTFDFDERDVGLCVTSLGFDLSVFDILGLLGRGAGLYIADEAQQRDPQLLLDVVLNEPITFWNSAPTTLNQLAPLFAERTGDPGTGDLRLVFLSGDYTPLSLPDAVRGLFPRARIVSLGGATEATVWSNFFPVGRIDPAWRSIPYGRPIDNARYYILDADLEPCPVGTEGDLYIAGDCLSLGYYNRPELTRERFLPDPFAREPGQRMYATGDRAAYFPDGNICFLGRADSQVKIRGFRVEPGEVEHRLRQHPGVRDAVVLAREDRAGERKLVAYVVAEDGAGRPTVPELRGYAAETLADYMVPNYVAFVDAFPATANGKLDRDALPWPLDATPAPVAPVTPDEATPDEATVDEAAVDRLAGELADLFGELLELSEVDRGRDLWDQGATSFTMVQVSTALRQRHGRRVPVSVLLADPTVDGIARSVAATLPDGPPPATPEPEPATPESPAAVGPLPAAAGPL
ncbi:MAG TPA: amino acid adenylation domain-containing protein, partial [Micromonosporaceae bacterium]|nr:amino acid adenylation domain-containing protein [Micromonosporaceae bacterium]